jgi:malonyl-ACP O-methyltransferase BioC
MTTDKQLIQTRFQRAAGTYDRQALIQHRVGSKLLFLLSDQMGTGPKKILEIGCCTGLLTGEIVQQYPDITLLHVNDLVPSFEDRIQSRFQKMGCDFRFLPGDIEQIRLPEQYDLIISSSTFHWLHDLGSLLTRLQQHLQPGGILAFSLYGPDNLAEIRHITGTGLDYLDLATVTSLLPDGLRYLCSEEHLEHFFYSDPMSVLEHLRQTGVNAIDVRPWTRTRLQQFVREYSELFMTDKGLRLTYHPMYVIAGKAEPRMDTD